MNRSIKIVGLLLLSTITYLKVTAQSDFTYEWNAVFGVNGANEKTEDVIYDSQGNLYHTGQQNVTIGQVFLQKLNTAGVSQWNNRFQGSSGSYNLGTALTLDGSDNIIMTGSFQNSLIPTGGGTHTSNGADDIFVAKYDNSGTLLWSFSIGGSSLDQGLDITTDVNDNIYVTGYFIGSVDFDPGVGATTLTSLSSEDIFLAKYDPNGSLLWAQSMGSTDGSNYGNGVATDAAGNVYLVGQYFGTVDFDPGVSTSNLTSAGSADGFVAKYSSSGSFQWSFSLGSTSTDQAKEISIDGNDNIYVAGSYRNTVDFDPSAAITSLTSTNTHVYLAKYTTAGSFSWVRDLAGNSLAASYCYGMSHSVDNEICVTGYFLDSMVVDVIDQTAIQSNGIGDAHFIVYSPSGEHQKSLSLGGTGWDYGYGVDVSSTGKIAVGGAFSSTVDFDPGTGTTSFNAMTGQNGFLVQYGAPPCVEPDVPSISATASSICDGSTVNLSISSGDLNDAADWIWYEATCGGTAIGSGISISVSPSSTTTYYVRGEGNCTSMTTCANVSIVVNAPTSGTDVQSACDSYTWIDGLTYTSSNNTATYTLTNAAGCDSLVTLDLVVTNSTTGTDVQSACDSYTWIDGVTYTSSNNTATYNLSNSVGCDSVVTLDLTIQQNTINTNISTSDGVTYTADDNTSGNMYSWVSISDGLEVSDSSSFTAPSNGTYQLEITNGLCSTVSSVITVSTVGIGEVDKEIHVYPNPTNGLLYFSTTVKQLTILTLEGKKVKEDQNISQIDLSTLPKGVYLIRVNNEKYVKINLN